MVGRGSAVHVGRVAMVALMFAGCSSPPPPSPVPVVDALDLSLSGLTISLDVQRLAVVYLRGVNPEWFNAYSQLEGAAFQLKVY